MAARSGAEPLVVAASVSEGLVHGRLWDLATGTIIGPPVPGHVDGADGTFGVVPAAGGDRPTVVVERENGMCVIDARTGSPVSECVPKHSVAVSVCLAELRGRTVVVSVRHEPTVHPRCQVWDAESGKALQEFTVWFPQYYAVWDPLLLAGPEIGDGAVLFTTQEELIDDGGWPPYAYDHAYLVLIDLATGEELSRFEGGPPVALHTAEAGPVVVFKSSDDFDLTAVHLPGGEPVTTFTGDDGHGLDIVAVGSLPGRDVVIGGRWHGGTATIWDLTRPDPVARIEVPGLQAAAVAVNGAIVLATVHGLFVVDPEALPAG